MADIHRVIPHIRHMTCTPECKEISQARVFAFVCLLGMFLSALSACNVSWHWAGWQRSICAGNTEFHRCVTWTCRATADGGVLKTYFRISIGVQKKSITRITGNIFFFRKKKIPITSFYNKSHLIDLFRCKVKKKALKIKLSKSDLCD